MLTHFTHTFTRMLFILIATTGVALLGGCGGSNDSVLGPQVQPVAEKPQQGQVAVADTGADDHDLIAEGLREAEEARKAEEAREAEEARKAGE